MHVISTMKQSNSRSGCCQHNDLLFELQEDNNTEINVYVDSSLNDFHDVSKESESNRITINCSNMFIEMLDIP